MKNDLFKKICRITLIVIIMLSLLGYGGYRLYHYALDHAIVKIQEKVEKTARKSVLGVLNPFSWPKRIFGGHRKHKNNEQKKEESTPAQETN